ncbi:MAG: AAA family ATPase, partial [Candidatus Eremiobacteraeota bacterium]|nr:AAA family ATPase [Candidatus Eremiobacteraeota bacterium]
MFLQRLKLRAPVVSPSWVDRAALRAAFRPGVRVLGVVAGPGYGKTVLASQLAAAWRGPTFWYGCDDTDADLAVFAAHLAALTSGGDLPSAPPATPKEVGANAAQALSTLENALVVFDDVHALHGRSLAALADLVERATSAGVSFVLCGRSLPLPVHGLAARGSYASLSATDLAFDEERSRAYLGAASGGRLSADRIAEFARRIEGWPVGLALAASMPAREHDEVSFDNAASLEILFEYFAAEVLDGLDEDDRRFLLETSILEHLEADACDAVAATDDARDRLARLVRRGLFIARNRSDAFDIHRLFLAFLRDRLAKEYGAADREILHERAAAFFAARRDDVGTIEHLIAANRRDRAADTLARCALALFASGRTAQLERLLVDLGEDRVRAEPVLAVARGRVL